MCAEIESEKACEDNERQDLIDYRQSLFEFEQKQMEQFDKAILTLTGATLGLSITFLKDVAADPPQHIWCMGISWLNLVGSIVCTVYSYIATQNAVHTERDRVDEELRNPETRGEDPPPPRQTARILNIVSCWLFFVGLFFFILFSFINLNFKGNSDVKTRKATEGRQVDATSNETTQKIGDENNEVKPTKIGQDRRISSTSQASAENKVGSYVTDEDRKKGAPGEPQNSTHPPPVAPSVKKKDQKPDDDNPGQDETSNSDPNKQKE